MSRLMRAFRLDIAASAVIATLMVTTCGTDMSGSDKPMPGPDPEPAARLRQDTTVNPLPATAWVDRSTAFLEKDALRVHVDRNSGGLVMNRPGFRAVFTGGSRGPEPRHDEHGGGQGLPLPRY